MRRGGNGYGGGDGGTATAVPFEDERAAFQRSLDAFLEGQARPALSRLERRVDEMAALPRLGEFFMKERRRRRRRRSSVQSSPPAVLRLA